MIIVVIFHEIKCEYESTLYKDNRARKWVDEKGVLVLVTFKIQMNEKIKPR